MATRKRDYQAEYARRAARAQERGATYRKERTVKEREKAREHGFHRWKDYQQARKAIVEAIRKNKHVGMFDTPDEMFDYWDSHDELPTDFFDWFRGEYAKGRTA
jgi:hypothetical protein